MLAVADPTLDLLVLELLFDAVLLRLLVLAVLFPSHARSEDDVLAYACRVERGSRRVALFPAELGPRPPLGDAGVDSFLDDSGADATGRFHLFAVVVESIGDDGFGAVFVGGD